MTAEKYGAPGRRNLIENNAEVFRPPVFRPNSSARNRFQNALRRALDLQAGTIWRELKIALADAHGNLLDVGCGAQIYRSLVPADVVYQGIDTVDAQAGFGYDIPNTRYFAGDAWGVPAGSIDFLLSTEVLEHVRDPAAFLAQALQCLRPGGQLLLTVPFAARWHFIPNDYWRFTPSGLDHLLAAAGFTDICVNARGNPLTVACYKAMALPILLLQGRELAKLAGILLLPMLGILAVIGNLSLHFDWGDDCLGYTVAAKRPGA